MTHDFFVFERQTLTRSLQNEEISFERTQLFVAFDFKEKINKENLCKGRKPSESVQHSGADLVNGMPKAIASSML